MKSKKGVLKNSNRKKVITDFFTVAIIIILAYFTSIGDAGKLHAEAAVRRSISSKEEFYQALAQQIYDREVLAYYTVEDADLRSYILNLPDLEEFGSHYSKDDPLKSGCYLVYYIQTIYFSAVGSELKIMVTYPYPKGNMDEHFENMEVLAGRLKGESDYETVKNVHDYLVDNFDYDNRSSMKNHTDIDGFKDGVMVCSGYGLAAYYLLNQAGVETRIITGYGGEGSPSEINHMWNMVRVDEKWYNLDVTWDDSGRNGKKYKYFLKNDEDFDMHVRMGQYAGSAYDSMVSRDSYKLPESKQERTLKIFVAILVLGTIAARFIRASRRRDEELPAGVVVNDYIPELDETMYNPSEHNESERSSAHEDL